MNGRFVTSLAWFTLVISGSATTGAELTIHRGDDRLLATADEAADPGHLRDALLDVLGIEIPSLDEIIAEGM